MQVWAVLFAVGLCAAIPLEQDTGGTYADLPYPEEVPGLFEGDIELRPGEDPTHRNVVGDKSKLWPHQHSIPYVIQSSYSHTFKTLIHQAMADIEAQTAVNGHSCVHFKPRTTESAYLYFATGSGCHTHVGYEGGVAKVTLGDGCQRKGTIMHEILHSLGFYHEQSRHDRDDYVTIHYDNIAKDEWPQFKKYSVPYIDELGQPYDYGSVMHYSAHEFALDRNKPSISPKRSGVVIGQRLRLSHVDVKEVQILYGCVSRGGASGGHATSPPAGGHATPTGCTFEAGLCGWTQSHSDQTNWRLHSGATPSSSTGPALDHQGTTHGHYLYIEATGHTNQKAKLESRSYVGGDYCVNFYLHMYGADMGSLTVSTAKAGHQPQALHTWTGDQGNRWHHYKLDAHVHTTGTFKFMFIGHTGSGSKSDMAIDDVSIAHGAC